MPSSPSGRQPRVIRETLGTIPKFHLSGRGVIRDLGAGVLASRTFGAHPAPTRTTSSRNQRVSHAVSNSFRIAESSKTSNLIDLSTNGASVGWSGFTGVGYPK